MKKRVVVCFFVLVFWGLMICTVLSGSISRQMTAKVTVIGQDKGFLSEIRLPADVLFSDENGLHLYEVVEGDNWEKGKRVQEVDLYQYRIEEEEVVVSVGTEFGYIRYASKTIMDGDLIQVVSQGKRFEGIFLGIMEEGIEMVDGIEKGNEVVLFSIAGKQPYMEEQMKRDLGMTEEDELYSLDEVIDFFENLPWMAGLLVLVLLFFILWVCSCFLLLNWYGNRYLLIGNLGIAVLLFGVFVGVTYRISLPSSLLPDRNIFEWSYYRREFLEVFRGLGELSGVVALEVRKQLEEMVLLAKGVILVGGIVGIGVLGGEFRVGKGMVRYEKIEGDA